MSQRIKDRLIDTVITVVGSIFLLFGSGAWSSKENAAEHKADIQELRELQQRTLDAVCDAVKVKPRTCTEPPRK